MKIMKGSSVSPEGVEHGRISKKDKLFQPRVESISIMSEELARVSLHVSSSLSFHGKIKR